VDPDPTPPPGDLSITGASTYFADPHHHLEMTVAALSSPTYVVLDVADYASHSVHTDRDFAGTTCRAAAVAGSTETRLTCRLVPGALGSAPGQFAIDVVVDGPLDVTARIRGSADLDADPANDEVRFTD
jgi:hypothetical protein